MDKQVMDVYGTHPEAVTAPCPVQRRTTAAVTAAAGPYGSTRRAVDLSATPLA